MQTGLTVRRAQRQDWTEADGRLYWIDGFLDARRCEAILAELEFSLWRRSTVYAEGEGGKHEYIYSGRRVSSSTSERWFTPSLRRTMRLIDRRIGQHLPLAISHREEWQATRYERGGRFDYHHDSGYFDGDAAGERTHSIVLYLDAPERGGQTRFPLLDLSVNCERGRLLIWSNLESDGQTDPDMVHSSMPVLKGRKTILVTWVRQRECRAAAVKRRAQ